jgi:Thermostable hemolysin
MRGEAEQFIKQTFKQNYSAEIVSFPETIMAVADSDHEIKCAASLRVAGDGFFSECYFDKPIEAVIGSRVNLIVDRNAIVEVSTLAGSSNDMLLPFIAEVVNYGELSGYDWAFFTLTQRLQRVLSRIGLSLITLGDAEARRVNNPQAWGSYYETQPKVCAVANRELRKICSQNLSAPEYA